MADPPSALLGPAWAVALLLPATALFSVLSAMLERSGPIRLSHWAEEAGGRLRDLYDEPLRFGAFRALLSIAGRFAPIALCVAVAALLRAAGRAHPIAWALGLTLVLLAVVEIGNRALVAHDPEAALRSLTLVYRAALLLFGPLVAAATALIPRRALPRHEEAGEDDEASDEEVEAFIDVGTREGILEPEEGKWLSNIVDFGDKQARSVMTPRIDMVCASADSGLDELAERFIESGHTRIPIFEESSDHIVGILHISDLLRALRSPAPPPLKELLKRPLFIPETKPLAELLKELQARSRQVAIVVDEYGGTAGLVTVEDLLEEIVGEIREEHDAEESGLAPVSEGVWRLDGRARVEVLDELFGVKIEDPAYETVAGLIFSALGRVPEAGETVEQYGLRLTVEAVDDRRIQTVRVERVPAADAQDGAAVAQAG